ncbi:MAG TPA: polysaccharide biosynthesis tyrosine autokinase [Kiritimatiellia bacterium]|nr:polysaccharide biosynthesis tyrosine autokinase [Kiritimatiellia bacterium]
MKQQDPTSMPPAPGSSRQPYAYDASPYHTAYPYYGGAYAHSTDPWLNLDPARLVRIVAKRWRAFIIVLLLFVTGAGLYMALAPRIYEASSSIEMNSRRPRLLAQQAAVIEDPVSGQQFETLINTQLEKFRSGAILPFVLELYLQANPNDPREPEAIASWLERNARFNLLRRTRLVQITFRSSDPLAAQLAADALAHGAEAYARAENRAISDNAVAWLEAQSHTQREAVEQADRLFSEARQTFRMDALQAERQTIQHALVTFNEALVNIERDIAKERELLDVLNRLDLTPENAGKLPTTIPRAAEVAAALERWQTAATERERLLSRYTVEHPEVRARDADTALLRNQAAAALERARNTTSANLQLLEQQAQGLRSGMQEQSAQATDLERQILDREMQLSSYQRARDAADLSYQGVLNRIQEARLSADENTTTIQVAQIAKLPETPVRPRQLVVLVIGLLLGGMIGVAYAVTTEILEDHVSGIDDVEYGAGLKILTVVPRVPVSDRKAMALASLHKSHPVVTEAFSGLRSALNSTTFAQKNQVILLASSIPAEGKTTTACNLAGIYALSGQKTLLIDFDLRRPRIAGIFPMPAGQRGLLDYLSDPSVDEQRLDYNSDFPNLRVIASRPVKDTHPAELMGNPKMLKLIEWARANFDRIILDAPPLGIVSDTLVLAGLSDVVLVMARPGTSRKRALRHTVKRFHEYGVTTLAAVVNDLDLSNTVYSGYSPYHLYHQHSEAYLSPSAGPEAPARSS